VIRLSGGKVELVAEHRPPMVKIELGGREYGLEAPAAFELAHSMAMIAMQLDRSLIKELKRRTEEQSGIWTP